MENTLFKQVGNFQYSSEAYIVKGKLESSGVEVFMKDNFTIDTDPIISNAIGGVKLFVRSEDYEQALLSLSEISKHAVDDSGKLLVCPNCGGHKIDLLSTIKDLKSLFSFIFSLLLFVLPFYTKYQYKCEDCNFEFTKQ